MTAPRSALRERCLNLLLLVGSVLVTLALAEGAVRWLDLWPRERGALATPAPQPGAASGEKTDEDAVAQYVLHPFVGWSPRPAQPWKHNLLGRKEGPRIEKWYDRNNRLNVLGFHSEVGDYRLLEQRDFVIGVFGGSVAQHLALKGGGFVVRRLKARHPELTPRIYVLNIAQGGYKQPSQLILLETLLMLGVPFDVVVNLDGFNETALGADDARLGRHPIFPYNQHLALAYDLNTGSPSAAAIETTADLLRLERKVEALRNQAKTSWLARLQGWRALKGFQVLRLERRRVTLEKQLQTETAKKETGIFELYDPCLGKPWACWDVIGSIWQRSSLAMDAIARRFGVPYLHVLQPNQYPEGAKPLSAEERACCYLPEGSWSQGAREGFPRLRLLGAQLRQQGVDFHDLSVLFAQHPETLYVDSCCHLNERGNQLLAEAVADRIADVLEPRGVPARAP